MKIEIAKLIMEQLWDRGDECSLREDYSGRSMYGKTTAGIVVPGWRVFVQAVAWTTIELATQWATAPGTGKEGAPMSPEDFAIAMGKLSWDSMGHDVIIY